MKKGLADLVYRSRSFRRFDREQIIPTDLLTQWIDTARHTPSAANRQPLKYLLITGTTCDTIFPHLSWAGALPDWPGPEPQERPSSYIAILGDKTLRANPEIDLGIAAQTILLNATESGYGGCMIAAFNRDELTRLLGRPKHLELHLILALGKPIEHVEIEEALNGETHYWRDENNIHHVPKRPLSEVLIQPTETLVAPHPPRTTHSPARDRSKKFTAECIPTHSPSSDVPR